MKIVIYGINYSPELTGIGKYTGEMSEWMAKRGANIKVITAPPYYPQWEIHEGFKNKYSNSYEENINIIRCPIYVPSKLNSLKRILHLLSFQITSFVPLLRSIIWRPDVVILVVPTLFCAFQTIVLTKLFGIKSLIHIQDFEVDAVFGLNMVNSNNLKKLTLFIETKLLNGFDFVSTISHGMLSKALNKGVHKSKLIYFPNWSEVDMFINAKEDRRFFFNSPEHYSRKIILYSGNIGEKQGLENILYAAKQLESLKDLFFIIIGEGAAKKSLQLEAKSLNIKNLRFLGLQPYKDLPNILATADCHLVVQKKGVADAVLPSKLTNILSVGGNAVITAEEETYLGKLCENNQGIAILVKPESVQALKDGILRAISMEKPNLIAKQYALDNLDKQKVLSRFFNKL